VPLSGDVQYLQSGKNHRGEAQTIELPHEETFTYQWNSRNTAPSGTGSALTSLPLAHPVVAQTATYSTPVQRHASPRLTIKSVGAQVEFNAILLDMST
jgi:hypothetical protein